MLELLKQVFNHVHVCDFVATEVFLHLFQVLLGQALVLRVQRWVQTGMLVLGMPVDALLVSVLAEAQQVVHTGNVLFDKAQFLKKGQLSLGKLVNEDGLLFYLIDLLNVNGRAVFGLLFV